jgi:hypothetical protein
MRRETHRCGGCAASFIYIQHIKSELRTVLPRDLEMLSDKDKENTQKEVEVNCVATVTSSHVRLRASLTFLY